MSYTKYMWKTGDVYMGVWWGNPKEGATGTPKCKWEDNIKWIFKKWDGEAWTGLIWLKVGTGGNHLCMQ